MLNIVLFSAALASSPPDAGVTWESYSSKPVTVECATVSDEPWCRSLGIIEAPIDSVVTALKDMRHNANLFESVVQIAIISEDTLRVARYVYSTDATAHLFRWTPVPGAAPEADGVVRLPDFAGEWRLEPTAEGHTQVRYTWHAAIHGSFPSWGYSTAWKKAGYEALKDLAGSQGALLRQ